MTDILTVNGASVPVSAPAGFVPAVAAYAPTTATFVKGQKKVSATGTAGQLAANALVSGVFVAAAKTNASPIVVGDSGVTNTTDGTGNGVVLAAGDAFWFPVSNTSALWINGAANDYVSFGGN